MLFIYAFIILVKFSWLVGHERIWPTFPLTLPPAFPYIVERIVAGPVRRVVIQLDSCKNVFSPEYILANHLPPDRPLTNRQHLLSLYSNLIAAYPNLWICWLLVSYAFILVCIVVVTHLYHHFPGASKDSFRSTEYDPLITNLMTGSTPQLPVTTITTSGPDLLQQVQHIKDLMDAAASDAEACLNLQSALYDVLLTLEQCRKELKQEKALQDAACSKYQKQQAEHEDKIKLLEGNNSVLQRSLQTTLDRQSQKEQDHTGIDAFLKSQQQRSEESAASTEKMLVMLTTLASESHNKQEHDTLVASQAALRDEVLQQTDLVASARSMLQEKEEELNKLQDSVELLKSERIVHLDQEVARLTKEHEQKLEALSSQHEKKIEKMDKIAQSEADSYETVLKNMFEREENFKTEEKKHMSMIQDLQKIEEDLKAKVDGLHKTNEKLLQSEKQLETRVQDLSATNAQHIQKQEVLNTRAQDLSARNEELLQSDKNLKAENQDLLKLKRNLLQERDDFRSREQALSAKYQTVVQSEQDLKNKIQHISAKNSELLQSKKTLESKSQELSTSNGHLLQKEKNLEVQNKDLLDANAKLQQDDVDLKAENQHLKETNQKLEQSERMLKRNQDDMVEANKKLSRKSGTYLHELNALKQEKMAFHTATASRETENKKKIDALNKINTDLKKDLDAIKAQNDDLEKTTEDIQAQPVATGEIVDLEKKELLATIEMSATRIKELEDRNEVLQAGLDISTEDKVAIYQRMNTATARQELERAISSARYDVHTKEQEIKRLKLELEKFQQAQAQAQLETEQTAEDESSQTQPRSVVGSSDSTTEPNQACALPEEGRPSLSEFDAVKAAEDEEPKAASAGPKKGLYDSKHASKSDAVALPDLATSESAPAPADTKSKVQKQSKLNLTAQEDSHADQAQSSKAAPKEGSRSESTSTPSKKSLMYSKHASAAKEVISSVSPVEALASSNPPDQTTTTSESQEDSQPDKSQQDTPKPQPNDSASVVSTPAEPKQGLVGSKHTAVSEEIASSTISTASIAYTEPLQQAGASSVAKTDAHTDQPQTETKQLKSTSNASSASKPSKKGLGASRYASVPVAQSEQTHQPGTSASAQSPIGHRGQYQHFGRRNKKGRQLQKN